MKAQISEKSKCIFTNIFIIIDYFKITFLNAF